MDMQLQMKRITKMLPTLKAFRSVGPIRTTNSLKKTQVVGDSQKARKILYGSLEHMQVSKPLLEAIIHLDSIQPSPKHVEKLDSLVDKYITPNSDNSIMESTTDREEISCIFMEVTREKVDRSTRLMHLEFDDDSILPRKYSMTKQLDFIFLLSHSMTVLSV